jgi:hypothetical protein
MLTHTTMDFFPFWHFFNQCLRNEHDQNFFSNLALLSRANAVDVTYEGVTPCAVPHKAGWRVPHR